MHNVLFRDLKGVILGKLAGEKGQLIRRFLFTGRVLKWALWTSTGVFQYSNDNSVSNFLAAQ
jgi:hypothetical protein